MKLIVVSAPSGAGKTTLCHRLLADFSKLTLSISSTTRKPRGAEVDGREYFFLTADRFKEQINQDRFAEWALVHGNYYGTSKDTIEMAFSAGKSVLLDIDVQGAASLKKSYPQQSLLLFVSPPDLATLEKRLRGRGTDSEEAIRKRLDNAKTEMARMNEFDHVVVNDDIDRAYQELKKHVADFLGEPRK